MDAKPNDLCRAKGTHMTANSEAFDVTTLKCLTLADTCDGKVVLFHSPCEASQPKGEHFYFLYQTQYDMSQVTWFKGPLDRKILQVKKHQPGYVVTRWSHLHDRWLNADYYVPWTKGIERMMREVHSGTRNINLTQTGNANPAVPESVDEYLKPIQSDQGLLFVFEQVSPYHRDETEAVRAFVLVNPSEHRIIACWVRYVDLGNRHLDHPLEVTADGKHLYFSPSHRTAYAIDSPAQVAEHLVEPYRTPRLYSDEQTREEREGFNTFA